jgi:hypothetical protein
MVRKLSRCRLRGLVVESSHQTLPTLRHRTDTDIVYYDKPITMVGQIVGVRDHWFKLAQGHGLETELCVDDFYDVLDGPQIALTLLIDAGLHNDHVKITLSHERLMYDNNDQIHRLAEQVKETEAQPATPQ